MKLDTINARRQPGYFPYYKIQWHDAETMAWRDIQHRYPSPTEALEAIQDHHPQDRQYRLMEVRQQGRRVCQ